MIRYLTELSMEAFTEAARNVPYQQVESELFPGVDLWIRRDDLIDPIISGNKAYKLIFNLLEAREQGKDTIVTCGGAWSNHIHATAAAGQRFGFKTIGIIRGERPPVLSAMLQDTERFGMELRFVSRTIYRKRAEEGFWAQLGLSGERYWYVPEGGANEQGARGVEIWGQVIRETCPVTMDECWLACGTGLTLGALSSSLELSMPCVGVAVLRADKSISDAVHNWGSRNRRAVVPDPEIITDAHHGGYGKTTESLRRNIHQLEDSTGVRFDHVYTAKVIWALKKRYLNDAPRRSYMRHRSVLLIHTGGLQGIRGMYKK
ncbi:1-aminocyclopropane-1-carboxylate deaminase/D-cysteine desulfhydrase [Microbulbifer sp. HZ11]|uniref:1-aminocyclopropane-1-carboxylate deaminase/D-cysteine desulfhydrase n=1 Tax=Microbulbifer sp. HZ11 TaxID=1453501 RepID=UPI00068E88BA|nr:pyridoxal-phosphate dependent enzyme [Microbulbifer sp. HZ11]